MVGFGEGAPGGRLWTGHPGEQLPPFCTGERAASADQALRARHRRRCYFYHKIQLDKRDFGPRANLNAIKENFSFRPIN